MSIPIAEGVYWVGHVDWNVRDFHGYRTGRGSTYNAYLIQDERPALIDTVKAPYAGGLLEQVRQLVDLGQLRYVVCNHAEPDHAGGLSAVMAACPQAELVCNEKCRATLGRYQATGAWRFRVVRDGETLSLGRHTLTFLDTPMVHWPESMFTYVAELGLLFSMDAFGQHYATSGRFDDEIPLDVALAEAKTYYANILMPFGRPIGRTLERAGGLDLKLVAPSHGVMWRRHIPAILGAYRDWIRCRAKAKALIIYDTMWGSTAKMAEALAAGALQPGGEVVVMAVRTAHITDVATEMLDAAAAAFGSPTLNGTLMPAMAGALTYLKGLRPEGKTGLAFGSYGWSKGGPEAVEAYLRDMKLAILREPIQAPYGPDAAALEACRQAGTLLAEAARRAVV